MNLGDPTARWWLSYWSFVYIWLIRSTTLWEYPYSLSYQEISLTNVGESWIPALASKIEDRLSDKKSVETTSWKRKKKQFGRAFYTLFCIQIEWAKYGRIFKLIRREQLKTYYNVCVSTNTNALRKNVGIWTYVL